MSGLTRFLQPSRRTYSSFSSSKFGGGRSFTSSKLPKASSVANAHGTTASASRADASSASDATESALAVEESFNTKPSSPILHQALHPTVTAEDFKVHQFFSLHRPLLLLQHPAKTLFDSAPSPPPTHPFYTQPPSSAVAWNSAPVENSAAATSPEADADAARQLARALMYSRASATVDWERTLRYLGDVQADRVVVAPMEIVMDSVKRKRKKKMRKHKLKKRRKATRAQRLKIGR